MIEIVRKPIHKFDELRDSEWPPECGVREIVAKFWQTSESTFLTFTKLSYLEIFTKLILGQSNFMVVLVLVVILRCPSSQHIMHNEHTIITLNVTHSIELKNNPHIDCQSYFGVDLSGWGEGNMKQQRKILQGKNFKQTKRSKFIHRTQIIHILIPLSNQTL